MERAELGGKLCAWRQRNPAASGTARVLIETNSPDRFMAEFAAAVAGEGEVILCDPAWSERERDELTVLLQSKIENRKSKISQGWLMIPTGGSSGSVKLARHDSGTLGAAVAGFREHFGLGRVNAVGLLPLHHVSGLMAWLRCAISGGEYRHLDWKSVEAGGRPELPASDDGWVISLVPTQLERLLRHEEAAGWLRSFRVIFLGGAPATEGLLARAAALGLRLSPGYGMTETAAMVTALRPDEFLAGCRSNGSPLPHARVAVDQAGAITVGGGSVFRGYYPSWREGGFTTADLGWIDECGRLHVLGRGDAVIVTGGEKVQPAEVEAVLRNTGEFGDIVVLGQRDAEWGQIVVAAYPAGGHPDLGAVNRVLGSRLAAFKRPKRFVAVADWPLTAAGKVNRAEIARRLAPA